MVFRRFGVFISRICLTIVLICTSLFFIIGLTKYFLKSDLPKYILVEKNSFQDHQHHHHHRLV